MVNKTTCRKSGCAGEDGVECSDCSGMRSYRGSFDLSSALSRGVYLSTGGNHRSFFTSRRHLPDYLWLT